MDDEIASDFTRIFYSMHSVLARRAQFANSRSRLFIETLDNFIGQPWQFRQDHRTAIGRCSFQVLDQTLTIVKLDETRDAVRAVHVIARQALDAMLLRPVSTQDLRILTLLAALWA